MDKIAEADDWEEGTRKCQGAFKLRLFTDGSLEQGTEGSYAWVCTNDNMETLMSGGEKENLKNDVVNLSDCHSVRTTKLSSTRQEALAILSLKILE